jgi:hypothetical protein
LAEDVSSINSSFDLHSLRRTDVLEKKKPPKALGGQRSLNAVSEAAVLVAGLALLLTVFVSV